MSGPKLPRIPVGAVVGRLVLVGLLTAVAWVIGLDLANALSLGFFVIAVYGLRLLSPGEIDSWLPEPESARNTGTRREVARLSWGLSGQDTRVDRWSARRLRALAERRLAARGLHLDDPDHQAACRELLGSRTYDALDLDPNRLPRYPDFVAALDTVERLTLEENPR